jgi:signal recognition particle receptor subunit beta
MVLFNHSTRELTAKIVYYGPGLCGKTTNLKVLHDRLEKGTTGRLLSLATAQDRTIYFDLLPVELGNIKGYTVRFQVCTVPGQVFYNETRKIVLRGVDGLVFVVDSQWSMLSHNLESFQNLKENLHEEKISLETLPVVIQYNKRDLPSALSVGALQDSLGFHSYPYVETVANEGSGVIETFKLVSKLTFVDLLRRLQRGGPPPPEAPAVAAEPASPAAIPEEAPAFTFVGSATTPDGASDRAEAPKEAPAEALPADPIPESAETSAEAWVVPSAEGTFPDLSGDAHPPAASPSDEGRPASGEPPAAQGVPETSLLAPAVLLAALTNAPPAPGTVPRTIDPPPATAASRAPAQPRTSTVDEKLNAVLAEARKGPGRVTGTYRRLDTPEATQEIPARDLAERRLEEAIAALRAEFAGEMARLRDELAAARVIASSAESAAALANDRLRRLEDALREAFRGLAG